MNRSLLAIFLIVTCICGFAIEVHNTRESPSKAISVPEDYQTIQAAIDNASPGDRIHVRSGIYSGSIVIDKSLSLVGDDKTTTILDGSGAQNVIKITSNDVAVANFTIRNAGTTQWSGHGFPNSCIDAEGCTDLTITNNLIMNATVGSWLYGSSNISIGENTVSDTTTMGIVAYSCTSSTIDSNLAQSCGIVGIHLDGSSTNCEIINNTVTACEEGIDIEKSTQNTIEENHLLNDNLSMVFNQANDNTMEYCNVEKGILAVGFIQSNDNTFSLNSFVDNVKQVDSDYGSPPSGVISVNRWDNSKQGNYWSDYQSRYPNASQIDSSGIWNTPYTIDSSNIDHYPLLKITSNPSLAPSMIPSPSVPELNWWVTLPLLLSVFSVMLSAVILRYRKTANLSE